MFFSYGMASPCPASHIRAVLSRLRPSLFKLLSPSLSYNPMPAGGRTSISMTRAGTTAGERLELICTDISYSLRSPCLPVSINPPTTTHEDKYPAFTSSLQLTIRRISSLLTRSRSASCDHPPRSTLDKVTSVFGSPRQTPSHPREYPSRSNVYLT